MTRRVRLAGIILAVTFLCEAAIMLLLDDVGLAKALNIARDHGGSLRVECDPGNCTRLVLDLPETRKQTAK